MAQLSQAPIAKPPKHIGGPETDFFQVNLTEEEVEQIICHLFDREAAAVSPDGETTVLASYYAGLVDFWGHLMRTTWDSE